MLTRYIRMSSTELMRLSLRRRTDVQGNSMTSPMMSGIMPGLVFLSEVHSMMRTTPETEI